MTTATADIAIHLVSPAASVPVGRQAVRALEVRDAPGLVITPGVEDDAGSYVVTHAASGLKLPGAWTLPAAVAYARRLAPLCDWTGRRPAVDTCTHCHADDELFRTCEGCYGLAAVPKGGVLR